MYKNINSGFDEDNIKFLIFIYLLVVIRMLQLITPYRDFLLRVPAKTGCFTYNWLS